MVLILFSCWADLSLMLLDLADLMFVVIFDCLFLNFDDEFGLGVPLLDWCE